MMVLDLRSNPSMLEWQASVRMQYAIRRLFESKRLGSTYPENAEMKKILWFDCIFEVSQVYSGITG